MTGRRDLLRRVARVVFVLGVLAALGLTFAVQGHQIGRRFGRLGAMPALGAFVAVLGALAASGLAWRAILADLGSPLRIVPAARIVFVGQLGKYLPGSVWPMLAQMELGRDAGVPRVRAATGYVVSTVLTVVTGGAVGILAVPALLGGRGSGRYALALLVVPAGVALLHPAVVNRLLRLALRLTRRGELERGLSAGGLLRAAGWTLVAAGCYGLQAFALAASIGGGDGARLLPLAVGGYALASVAGLLFVIAPAGAGVREAVLVAVLSTAMPVAAATAVALVSRLLVTAGDTVAAGSAALSARAVLRRAAARAPEAPLG
ncbi:MAG TPA: lysylphosphatidylglycerol synthase domain-containing protein [Mycobacteriales bacterium]|nr:lysylphosphatidylglycerol synthase domain-containing protein [Mycobacteriales bacterium]